MPSTIDSIEIIPLAIPFTHAGPPTGFGGTVWTKANYLLLKVTTSDGLTGWGEAFGYNVIPATRAALETIIKPQVIGKPSEDISALMDALERPLHIFGRSGPVQYALSGLDIALWDIAGKRAGMSVARLLGSGARRRIPAYTSLLRIGEKAALQSVCETMLARGFEAVKLHEIEPALAVAARQALGPDTDLMMDVNCAWDVTAAIQAARDLAPARLTWLEEPVWPPENLAGLNAVALAGCDIAAGENIANPVSFVAASETAGLTYLQPSVTKVGGISAFAKVAHLAALKGKQLAPHSPYFGPGYLATLQLASAFPMIRWIEMFAMDLASPVFGGAELPDSSAHITIPDGPGLGLEPDPAVLREFRID